MVYITPETRDQMQARIEKGEAKIADMSTNMSETQYVDLLKHFETKADCMASERSEATGQTWIGRAEGRPGTFPRVRLGLVHWDEEVLA